jgi:hypothetical protein
MKTTQKQFEQFKAEVQRYCNLLSLGCWKLYFEKKRLDSIAYVYFNSETCCATFCVCDEYQESDEFDPVISARHEVYHLFCARMIDLGCMRFIRKQELLDCAEQMARVLTQYELRPCLKS